MVIDSFGASETGADGTRDGHRRARGGPRFTMDEHMTVLDDDAAAR